MSVATILLIVMWVYAGIYFIFLAKDVIAHKDEVHNEKLGLNIIVSLIANFFDTLGIGSYPSQLPPGSLRNLLTTTSSQDH